MKTLIISILILISLSSNVYATEGGKFVKLIKCMVVYKYRDGSGGNLYVDLKEISSMGSYANFRGGRINFDNYILDISAKQADELVNRWLECK